MGSRHRPLCHFQRQRAHSINGTSRIYRRAGSERASGQTAIPRVSFFGKGILFCGRFSQRYPSMSSTAGGLGVNGCIIFHRLHYDHGTSHWPPPPTSVTTAVSLASYVFKNDLPGTRQRSTAQPRRWMVIRWEKASRFVRWCLQTLFLCCRFIRFPPWTSCKQATHGQRQEWRRSGCPLFLFSLCFGFQRALWIRGEGGD